VKKNELTKAVLAALVLASSSVMAESDYPAADFQPKVLYNDPEYKQAEPSAKGESAVPKVAQAAKEVEADPAYPATNFQPKVLYSDSEYKHSSAAPTAAGASSKASATMSSARAVNEVIQSEKAPSSDFSMIGLLVLAAAGFLVYSKKSGGKASTVAAGEDYSRSGDSTGVEKYLEKIGANKTGVAKYLEKQTANPATGVAKYMAKQIVKDKEAAAARATGVEKYLRDKS
jgi:hypothetical protein